MWLLSGKTCPTPAKVENGNHDNPKPIFHFEDKLTYRCNLGYKLNAPVGATTTIVTCRADGTWDKTFPKCEGKCKLDRKKCQYSDPALFDQYLARDQSNGLPYILQLPLKEN